MIVYWKLRDDPHWRPYCLVCPSMLRMIRNGDTFTCQACRNVVGLDMKKQRCDA